MDILLIGVHFNKIGQNTFDNQQETNIDLATDETNQTFEQLGPG